MYVVIEYKPANHMLDGLAGVHGVFNNAEVAHAWAVTNLRDKGIKFDVFHVQIPVNVPNLFLVTERNDAP